MRRLFWSAVLSTITVRPTLARSSAVTLWISAHCSPCAPGGVSQRTCQSLWTDLTAPCALARSAVPAESASTIAVAASNDLIVRKSIPGLNEPIICASNSACAPLSRPSRIGPSDHGRGYVSRMSKTRHCGRERVETTAVGGAIGRPLGRMGDMKVCIAIGPELWFERPGFPSGPATRAEEPTEECRAQCGQRLRAVERALEPHSKEQCRRCWCSSG